MLERDDLRDSFETVSKITKDMDLKLEIESN